MPDKAKETETAPAAVKYKTEKLLESKAFSGYQRDFAGILLAEPEYTAQEARSILERFFGKEGK